MRRRTLRSIKKFGRDVMMLALMIVICYYLIQAGDYWSQFTSK